MAAVLKKNERNCTASFAREENGKTVTDKVKTPTLKLDCAADDIDAVITGLEVLKEDLAIAARLPVNHISYYSLMIKDNTPFHRWIQTGQIKLVDDETERYMYHLNIKSS